MMNCPNFSKVALFLDLIIHTNISADNTPFASAERNSWRIYDDFKLTITLGSLS